MVEPVQEGSYGTSNRTRTKRSTSPKAHPFRAPPATHLASPLAACHIGRFSIQSRHHAAKHDPLRTSSAFSAGSPIHLSPLRRERGHLIWAGELDEEIWHPASMELDR